jgi:carbamoyltransferase
MTTTRILGISAYYHDSAAALIESGQIIAAAQEERFTRLKHDPAFPAQAIQYCLQQGNIALSDLDAIVFYDKPFLTFERLLETYLSVAPRGLRSFLQSMPVWLKEKLFLKQQLRRQLAALADCDSKQLPKLLFTEHHQAHAASAFYPSPFEKAAVLCLDGVGEWATSSAWLGEGKQLQPLWQINFPHSLGLLYSAFTYFCGFKVNSGEYKLMGLAPYGKPVYQQLICEQLIDIKADGSFQLNMDYFDYCIGDTMTNAAFAELFGGPPRQAEAPITERELNLAASVQAVTEQIIVQLAQTIKTETGAEHLCLAGGVALNCSANGKLQQSGLFKQIWIQPAAGDAGGAIGAALACWHQYYQGDRQISAEDNMQGAYLGPQFSDEQIGQFLTAGNIPFERLDDQQLFEQVAQLIDQGNIIGWFQGRMEFGPRALGNRSIIADPRNPAMQSRLNVKIKFRESFRPFAPSVLVEKAQQYFDCRAASPYMLTVAQVQPALHTDNSQQAMDASSGLDKLYCQRSTLPAITHIDYSARLQTVSASTNPRYHQLISAFELLTGCAVLTNTSFNVRGEPVVCSPEDAWQCFIHTDMDYLVLGNYVLDKRQQPARPEHSDGDLVTTPPRHFAAD